MQIAEDQEVVSREALQGQPEKGGSNHSKQSETHLPRCDSGTGARSARSLHQEVGKKYPAIGRLWLGQWERVIPMFAFSPETRKVIYTTNAVESLHMSLRKVIKNRGSFPNEESALKLMYLALRNASAKWQTVQRWREALNRFEILWGGRLRKALATAA